MQKKFLSCLFLATVLWSQTAIAINCPNTNSQVDYSGANPLLNSTNNSAEERGDTVPKKSRVERFCSSFKAAVTSKKCWGGLLCGTVIASAIFIPFCYWVVPLLKGDNSTTLSPHSNNLTTLSLAYNNTWDQNPNTWSDNTYLDFRNQRECKKKPGICFDIWSNSHGRWGYKETPVTYLGANCIFNENECPQSGSFAGGEDVRCYEGTCYETIPNTVDQRTGIQVSHNIITEKRFIPDGAAEIFCYSQVDPSFNFFHLYNPNDPSHWMPYGINTILEATQHMKQIVAYQPQIGQVNTSLIPLFFVFASNLQLGPGVGGDHLGFRNNENTYFAWASRVRVSQESIDNGSILHEMLHVFLNHESYQHFGFVQTDYLSRKPYFSGPKANAIAGKLGLNRVYLAENYHHLANGMGQGIQATSGTSYDEIYLRIGVLTQASLEDLELVFERSNSLT